MNPIARHHCDMATGNGTPLVVCLQCKSLVLLVDFASPASRWCEYSRANYQLLNSYTRSSTYQGLHGPKQPDTLAKESKREDHNIGKSCDLAKRSAKERKAGVPFTGTHSICQNPTNCQLKERGRERTMWAKGPKFSRAFGTTYIQSSQVH